MDQSDIAFTQKLQNDPSIIFNKPNVKSCFKQNPERVPYKTMQSRPENLLKSLEFISPFRKKHSLASEGTDTHGKGEWVEKKGTEKE